MERKKYDPRHESEVRFETAKIAAQILKQQKPEIIEVLLFGSVARQEARPDSDIDIAVVTQSEVDWDDSTVLDILLNAPQKILPLSKAGQFNPTVISLQELTEKSTYHSFYQNIVKDGIPLLK